jgi:hypothetical protein
MARNVTALYTATPQLVVDGVKYTLYRATIRFLDHTVVMSRLIAFADPSADFTSVPAGTYYARVELSHADGLQVGPGADSAPFVVPDDDATLEVPMSVNVVVHPLP